MKTIEEFLRNINYYETIVSQLILLLLLYGLKKLFYFLKNVKQIKTKTKRKIKVLWKKYYLNKPTVNETIEIQRKKSEGLKLTKWENKAYEKYIKVWEEVEIDGIKAKDYIYLD
jgi:hypothetical protein